MVSVSNHEAWHAKVRWTCAGEERSQRYARRARAWAPLHEGPEAVRHFGEFSPKFRRGLLNF